MKKWEVFRGQTSPLFSPSLLLSNLKPNLVFLGKEACLWTGCLGGAGGMDVHVKEGQLYVQHQKFGKVSSRQKKESKVMALRGKIQIKITLWSFNAHRNARCYTCNNGLTNQKPWIIKSFILVIKILLETNFLSVPEKRKLKQVLLY